MNHQASTTEAGASASAIQYHYDSGNEFFRLWLDDHMLYSGAMYDPGDSHDPDEALGSAQLRKLDYHVAQARAGGAARVLDVGCGWGGLLRRLVEHHRVGAAVGLTLSPAQARRIGELGDPRVSVSVESWQDHAPDRSYDAIISIGALEHFVRRGLPAADKIAAYRQFFRFCHRVLAPNARLSLQTIAYGTLRPEQLSAFITGSIFPESDLPRFCEVIEAMDRLFEPVLVRNDPADYGRTCRAWASRLIRARDQALPLVGADKVEDYIRYLRMSAAGFEQGALALLRLTLRRIGAD